MKEAKSFFGHGFCFVLLVVVTATYAIHKLDGQVLYGSIVGNITDATGAAVPRATVRSRQIATNETREATTNDVGIYTLSTLPAGIYDVAIFKPGFRDFAAQNVEVRLNTAVRVDAQLALDVRSERLQVSAEATLLQTDQADVHADVTSQDFMNLPQPTRTYEGLLGNITGVDPPSASSGGTNNPVRSMSLEANGTSLSGTDVRIEGVSAVNPWVQFYSTAVPSVEAIEAVNMVTGASQADQTLVGGAAINVQMKRGTNTFHGSLYEYHEDNALKARPFFLPAGQGKPKAIDNDPGGTLGGPIIRNRLFFFASYEGDFTRSVTGQFGTVPTTAMLKGDFSQTGTVIYNPLTGNPDGTGKIPFPGDQIPPSLLSPISQKLAALVPAPNTNQFGPNANNFYGNLPTSYNLHKIDAKVDFDAAPRLRVTGRIDDDPYLETQDSIFGPILGTSSGGGYPTANQHGNIFAFTGSTTFVKSPAFIIDGSWGFTRSSQYLIPIDDSVKYGSSTLGIPGVNLSPLPAGGGLPQFNINGYTGYGYSYPYLKYLDPVFQYSADATRIKGSHSIKFGMNLSQQHMNHNELTPDQFSFSGGVTALNGGPQINQFNGYADFLLGLPSSWSNALQPFGVSKLRSWEYALYLQDTWQVSNKLTVIYGASREYFPVPTHGGHGQELYNPDTNVYEVCGYGGIPKDCGIGVAKDLFAPKLGLAYRPSGSWVIRAGYSLSPEQINMARDGIYNYPETLGYSGNQINPFVPVGLLSAGIPTLSAPNLSNGVIPIPAGISFQTDPLKFHRGFVESYNLSVQKKLDQWLLQVGYVGTLSLHQHTRYDINYGQVGGGVPSQSLYQLDGLTNAVYEILPYENSRYDSLQIQAQRRFANGFQFNAGYTFSKWVGTCCEANGDGEPEIPIPQYSKLNYALEPGDLPNVFHVTGIAQLPFGKGKYFAQSGIGAALIGGWQISGVLSMFSGSPFSVTADGTSLNAPGSTQRADQVMANAGYTGNINEWFNPLAFAPVTTARFGTAGFDTLRGPGTANLDASLFRTIKVHERWSLQIRAECFNVANTPHFSTPGANVSSMQVNSNGTLNLNGFTQITSVNPGGRLVDERYFRLGLKIVF
jgi:hypothetical protein